MLENLRRKSLVKTYHDPIHKIYFEQGLARYGDLVEIDLCTQRLSKKLQKIPFKKTIDMVSKESFVYFKLNMIYCPSGKFTMGHKDYKDNLPKEETIARPFLLGETEITQELYEKVIGKNPSHFKNPQNPVEKVLWKDATNFCNELSKLQGLDQCYNAWGCDFSKNGYRLPSGKEWEYAAKAGTENRWSGTDDENQIKDYAWFDGNSNNVTHPVKTKKPNEWGFYDMSGNVSEWSDDEKKLYADAPSFNYYLSGGLYNNIWHLRSANRALKSQSDASSHQIGFRVARSLVN